MNLATHQFKALLKTHPIRWKYFLILLWLGFVLIFAAWWMTFSLDQIARLLELVPERQGEFLRQRRMLIWEGLSWFVLLLGGGLALIYQVAKNDKKNRQVREFFGSFSHDLKTSIASLRLQAEALKEDFRGHSSTAVDRLVSETVRLQIQLENSLYLAGSDSLRLYLQNIDFSKILRSVSMHWPHMIIKCEGKAVVYCDERALVSILENILQNAHLHGQAQSVSFQVVDQEGDNIQIDFHDDGKGFEGEVSLLGRLFYRPKPTSGTGLGLYLVGSLLKRMGGDLKLKRMEGGFGGSIILRQGQKI